MNTLDLSEGFLSPETLAALRVSSDSNMISALLTSNIHSRDVVAVVVDNIYTNGIHLLLIAKKYKQDIAITAKIIEHWNASREVFDCLATSTSSKVRGW